MEMPVYRPPSEAQSLLIQLTIGCSNNRCTYCNMYRSKQYRVRSNEEIINDLRQASQYYEKSGRSPRKLFFCDGDALGAPFLTWQAILPEVHKLFPNLHRVGVYATAENILQKSEEELKWLASMKLNMAYLGLESGSDEVLHMLVKGNTAQEMIDASLKIKQCGWQISTIAMLGVGGKKYSEQHIQETAKIISQTAPDFFSFLSTVPVEGTPYFTMVKRGTIIELKARELLVEMRDILAQIQLPHSSRIIFRANHSSNMHPISGILPGDREKLLKTIDEWISETPEAALPIRPSSL